jgi:hypothetical protein
MLYLFTLNIMFYQQMLYWYFGHYKTLTTLRGEKSFQ